MNLFDVLSVLDPSLDPSECKIHLAVWNGEEDPLAMYFEGCFDDWQAWQSKRNFERPIVVSLIALPARHCWLFAGTHASDASRWEEARKLYRYELVRRPDTDELDGRMVIRFHRPGRQSYLFAERWADQMNLEEVLPRRMAVAEFPGYSNALLTKKHLDLIVRQGVESWRTALQNVGGVYSIVDRQTGRQYVGSATGEGGIWSRWCAYVETGHGGNTEIRRLLTEKGPDYAQNFHFGILEIAERHTSAEDLLERESRWKDLLMSKEHGLNAN